jgi:hypothetical protein
MLVLLAGIAFLSTVATITGLEESRLALQKARKDVMPEELAGTSGWLAVYGCIRHDLAVGVSRARGVFRVGTAAIERRPAQKDAPPPEDPDRVYTPLAARDDCDEAKPPKRVYALIENDDSLGDTITHVYKQAVAPPPVPAIVAGVVGRGAGHRREAARARAFAVETLGLGAAGVGDAPLLVKGRRPGVLWVAVLTAAAGLHGYALVVVAIVWAVRRHRRRRAIALGHTSEAEEEFWRSETPD